MNKSGKSLSEIGWIILLCLILFTGCTKKTSLDSLMEAMISRENLSYFPEKQFTHQQFSSYNRASISPDKTGWFANADMSHFLRVESNSGRREFVMLDTTGPGAIVRWWMTFYKAQNGIIRVYLDGDTTAVLEGAPNKLVSGNLLSGSPLAASVQAGAPLGEAGRDYDHNLYVPIPFAKHCKITYECDSLVLLYDYEGMPVPEGYYWPDVFYNIGYRSYTKNIEVKSLSLQALDAAKPLLAEAGKTLLNNEISSETEEAFETLISPGDSLIVECTQKHYAINRLMVELEAENMPQALRSTVLHVTFDDYQTIWAPVGEFFGTGVSLNLSGSYMFYGDSD